MPCTDEFGDISRALASRILGELSPPLRPAPGFSRFSSLLTAAVSPPRGLLSPLTPDKMHAAPPPPTGSGRILPPSRGASGGANDEAAAVAAAASASAASSWQLVVRLRGAARRWRRTRRARAAASLLTMARQDWWATPRGLLAHLDLRVGLIRLVWTSPGPDPRYIIRIKLPRSSEIQILDTSKPKSFFVFFFPAIDQSDQVQACRSTR